MALIIIENLFNKTISANDHSRTVLQHFHDNGIDWMHSCGGKGRCTTCKLIITEGRANFQTLTPAEERYSVQGALESGERLACQAKITGDVSVRVPKEYQLPHIEYSDEA
jgi:ferredoxin, 2Fe-2S